MVVSKIPFARWPLLREAFRRNWPKHLFSVGLLDHHIKRIERYPEWQNKITLYESVSNDQHIKNDATFVVDVGHWIYFDSLTDDNEKISKILNSIKHGEEILFLEVRSEFRKAIYDFSRGNSFETIFDRNGWLVVNNNVEKQLPVYKNLIQSLPEEFILKSLQVKDIDFIRQKWNSELLHPEELVTCIKNNPTTGLYRKADNRLISWVIICENGMNGNLYVDEEFRARNLSKYVFAAQTLKVFDQERIQYAVVNSKNDVAINFFKSLKATFGENLISIKLKRKAGTTNSISNL